MNLLVMSNKRYKTDFRKHLIRVVNENEKKAAHVYCWEEIVITHNERQVAVFPPYAPPSLVFEEIKKALGGDPDIVLTGLGGYMMDFALSARQFLLHSQFVYDVYDDLRYGARGLQLCKRLWWDYRWRRYTDWTLVLDHNIGRLYSKAIHLDNASHLKPLSRPANLDTNTWVYIGSIDRRVDFAWLEALIAQGVRLDIWGRIHNSSPEAQEQISSLTGRYPGVNFRGEYDNDNLSDILNRYRVGVLPYKSNDPLTRYVNPDKLYHYLNSGLEVVATPIPQVQQMADYIHVASRPDLAALAKAIAETPRAGRWPADRYTWQCRWIELQETAMQYRHNKPQAEETEMKTSASISSSKPTPSLPRLQLGCGNNILPGWLNTDLEPLTGASKLDFSKPLSFPDRCFEAVFCEHTIEHVPKETALTMCREVYRVLRPGGVFRIVTPSLENMAALALSPNSPTAQRYLSWYRRWNKNPQATLSDTINAMFYHHGHQHIYSREELSTILLDMGFLELKSFNASQYGDPAFNGVDAHGKVIGEDINAIEAFALEVKKPA